jgi:ADP-dependent NAD(P)H-hydrate dehydratase / NAD(P)H-hydrate epimerase
MKILPVPLIREADAYTIRHEPIADIDLMERAASRCFEWLDRNVTRGRKIMVFCGSGNNGGDGLAIARMMHDAGFRVTACILAPPEKMSESCRINFKRMQERTNAIMHECNTDSGHGLPEISRDDLVVDAIFGSGLTRPVEGLAAEVIRHINSGGAQVVAIDVPSGLFCDETTPTGSKHAVVRADHTLTFSPKLAFFFPENDMYAGEWELLDIGLSRPFIESAATVNFMMEKGDAARILKKRNKFAHKGNFGHALLICGSEGKMGAAVLAAKGCLRSGPGLVTVHVPRSGIGILQTAVPEAMLSIDESSDRFTKVPGLGAYSSVAVGPGIGTSPQAASALKILIQETKTPVIFDADAINLLSENRTWLGFIPPNSIFTPHPKEFERLAGKSSDDFARNRLQREFSYKYQCYVVLKGAYTAITTPDGRCFFNTTGNPGMATGGSGDVLTGIIAGLAAQGYLPLECCLLGAYLHGLAGDLACAGLGFEAMTANDITEHLGNSFQSLYGKF